MEYEDGWSCEEDERPYVSRFRIRKGSRFNPKMRLFERIWAKRPAQVLFVTSLAKFNRRVRCAQRWKAGTFGYAWSRPGKKVIIPLLKA